MKSKVLKLKNPTFEYNDSTYDVVGISQLWGVFPAEEGVVNAISGWKWVDERSFVNAVFIEAFKPNGRAVLFNGNPLICLQEENAIEVIQNANFGNVEMQEYVVNYATEYIQNIHEQIENFNRENAED